MTKFIVEGSATLQGSIKVGGSKNAALPILAATLLATKPVRLSNVPAIRDVDVMLEALEAFGMKVVRTEGSVELDPADLHAAIVPDSLATNLRASLLLLGPALARFGEYDSVHPGGDLIGKRPLDTHFRALEAMGAVVTEDRHRYHVRAKRLRGTAVFLEEPSVTATENVLMAGVYAEGETVIKNAASELHVRDLAHFLETLGGRIAGAGTNKVVVQGDAKLDGGAYTIRADEVEAGTLAIAGALTGGDIRLTGVDPEHFGLILVKLREAGVNLETRKGEIRITGPHRLSGTNLKTHTWPGFPTDLSSPFTVLMTQAKGISLIHDHMYEGRFFYTDKLVSMGANITMADPHRVIVFGPTKLHGHEVESPDIRAGVTMVLAALVADGTTTIDHAELIDRGYERVDERLTALGAKITRVAE